MKELEKILDIMPSEVMTNNQPLYPCIFPKEEPAPEDPDFDYARLNLYSIIEQGKAAMEGALRVAEQSEHPRAYEVVGTLLKSMAEINAQLLKIGKDREDVKTARKGNGATANQPQVLTQNNTSVFVGSSSDLSKLLKEAISGKMVE
jgi:hypothetical protein